VIAYFDASALVKRYLVEQGSQATIGLTAESEMIATSTVTRAEVAAALAKAARVGLVTEERARSAERSFAGDWPDLVRVPVTEALVERAAALAWDHQLRGYDAVQFVSALAWQESIGTEVVLATFDQQLWAAAPEAGVKAWPDQLP
jgi:predicted nucleic acid-binding protein